MNREKSTKAVTLASQISRVLTQDGFNVNKVKGKSTKDGCRVSANSNLYSGLPTAKVTLDYFVGSADLAKIRTNVIYALRVRGYHVLSAPASDNLVVASHPVRYESVASSDSGKPPYIVRIEAGKPTMCNCLGFMYRLSCRHTDEVREATACESSLIAM